MPNMYWYNWITKSYVNTGEVQITPIYTVTQIISEEVKLYIYMNIDNDNISG